MRICVRKIGKWKSGMEVKGLKIYNEKKRDNI